MALRYYIRTYGCQMNERDTEALHHQLQQEHFVPVDREQDADVLVYNTCSVREKAEDKVIGKVGSLRRLKKQGRSPLVGIIGCMAQNHGATLLRQLEHVDFVVGTDQIQHLPTIIRKANNGEGPLVKTEQTATLPELNTHDHDPNQVSAYISVMRGCNQFCSYCIVPYVRGREKSRTIEDIKKDTEKRVTQGAREIFLLGQSITAYGVTEKGKKTPAFTECWRYPFVDLLEAVHSVPGVDRIRFTSPHPAFMDEKVLERLIELPKVCKAFHIPLQSGSDRILKSMRRGYTAQEFLRIIDRLRGELPEVSFSTDVMVGFPGETEEDFNATRHVMKTAGFEMAYVFKYSPRSGTKAAAWTDDVAEDTKLARNHILLEDLNTRSLRTNEQSIGREVDVLVEGRSPKNPNRWTGRSELNKVCLFEPLGNVKAGDMVRMYVEDATTSALYGTLHSSAVAA